MDPQDEIRMLKIQLELANKTIRNRDEELAGLRQALGEVHPGIKDERDDYIAMLEGRLEKQGRKLQMLERCLGSIQQMSTEALGGDNGRMGDEVRVPMFDARVPMFQPEGLMDHEAQRKADEAYVKRLVESETAQMEEDHKLALKLSGKFEAIGLYEKLGTEPAAKLRTGPMVNDVTGRNVPSGFVLGAVAASMMHQNTGSIQHRATHRGGPSYISDSRCPADED